MPGKKKRRPGYVEYDYEAAFREQIDQLGEWFREYLAKQRRKSIYAVKEITAGTQLEIEIYPQFKKMDDVPEEGRIRKRNPEAQKRLNDKNSRKYIERLINANFGKNDIWMTLTYDAEHVPEDGDMDTALKNMRRFIAKVNYRRKKKGLENARYIYVTEYSSRGKIRWHHHLIMDGDMSGDEVEKLWSYGRRNEVRRLEPDENGLTGMSKYIVKESKREKNQKRWNCSKNLLKPGIKVVHNKRSNGRYRPAEKYVNEMVRDQNRIRTITESWYANMHYTDSEIYCNPINGMFYIHVRMRRKEKEEPEPPLPWEV